MAAATAVATAQANAQLGYSIEELCLKDPQGRLSQTQFTQPALFVINAFTGLAKVEQKGSKPDYLAGHSLGEYNALFAAGVFDFLTGLKLVQKRGELMSGVQGGGMAAVVGRIRECPLHDVKLTLLSHNLVRGAAGAALLNAELLAARGFLKDRSAKSATEVAEPAVR